MLVRTIRRLCHFSISYLEPPSPVKCPRPGSCLQRGGWVDPRRTGSDLVAPNPQYAEGRNNEELGMKAGDVMTTGAATVRPDAPLAEAARLMIEHHISGLPVVSKDGELVGVVTEHDFLKRESGERPRWLGVLLQDAAAQITARDLDDRKVEDVMSRNPLTVDVETPLEAIVELMERHNVKRFPVVRKREIVGIVSRADLIRALMRKADSASNRG